MSIKSQHKTIKANLLAPHCKELEQKCELQETRIDDMRDRAADQARLINDQRGRIESLQKEVEAYRNENVSLRENMQHALGYIDRVNEDPEQPEQFIAQQAAPKLRGPQLQCDTFSGTRGRNY